MIEKLAIIIAEKRPFGYIPAPYIIDCEHEPIYSIVEQVTPTKMCLDSDKFNDDETTIITTLHKLSEQSLFKTFSKEKSTKAFHEKLTEETLEKFIRPYIDNIIHQVLPLVIRSGMPIFQKDVNYGNLYETDKVIANSYPDQTRFHFGFNDKGDLIYSLKLAINGQEESLFKKNIIELTCSPASFILRHKLYHFKNIDIKKFRPFLQRNSILIPETSVKKYMETYVLQCIKNHYVVAHGFKIIKAQGSCKPVVCIEEDVFGYNFYLYFDYNKKRYPYGALTKHVELKYEDGNYTFYSYPHHTQQEEKTKSLLTEIGLHIDQNNILVCDDIADKSAPDNFIKWIYDKTAYLNEHEIAVEMNTSKKYYHGSVELKVDVTDKPDWFDINGVVIIDNYEIPFYKLHDNIVSNNPVYILPDGSIFIIPDEWFAQWNDILTFAKKKGDTLTVDKMHASLMPQGYIESESSSTELTLSDTVRQGKLNTTLRPYQEDGFKWMNTLYENHHGGILADDMGLGKTVQTIALLSHIYATAPQSNEKPSGFNTSTYNASLIIMPVSLIHNWTNEIKKFAPHLRIYNLTGRNRLRTDSISKTLHHYHVAITTYGLLRNDSDYLSKYKFHYVILDESQYIKNPSSKTYHSLTKLQSSYRMTISGTPIENRLVDLWAQMNFCNPGLLGNLTFFKNHFETPITRSHDEKREQKLKKITAPFILRRTKEMVADDLPPITYQTVYCPMSEEQKSIYEKEKSSYRNELWKDDNESLSARELSFKALQAFTRLRLISNHPVLVDSNYIGNSGKFDIIIERICNISSEGHKMLIFSSFVKDLNLISKELKHRHIGHCMLSGSTSNREEVIYDFNSDKDKNIFLISLKAGGVGLNLTSADYVFILNPWWNPQAEAQAINRAHRIGQTKNVFVYRFISEESIEEKIDKLQEKKRDLAENFITNNNPLYNLNEDELKELFD
jgi:superfamily II DNA or RNA helicase